MGATSEDHDERMHNALDNSLSPLEAPTEYCRVLSPVVCVCVSRTVMDVNFVDGTFVIARLVSGVKPRVRSRRRVECTWASCGASLSICGPWFVSDSVPNPMRMNHTSCACGGGVNK